MKKLKHLHSAGGTISGCGQNENSWQFLKKFPIDFPYDSAVPLRGKYAEDLDTHAGTDTHTEMLTAASFTVARRWKQPPCPLADDGRTNCGFSIQWSITQP